MSIKTTAPTMATTMTMSKRDASPFIVPARLTLGELRDEGFDDAVRFIEALAGDDNVSFQALPEQDKGQRRLTKIIHGTLTDHSEKLHRLNQQGAGIFVMVNEGDGKGRKVRNVTKVRALFVDLDGAPLEPVLQGPIEPHIIVETSPGRWHAYWRLNQVPLESFSHLQTQLAKRFNGDRSIKDLCRIMRVPGFMHNKREPYRSRIVHLRNDPAIDIHAFLDAFDFDLLVPVGERNSTLFKSAVGFKHAGIPQDAAAQRIAKMNVNATAAPLPAMELASIVAQAYQYETDGFSAIPHALVDRKEFQQLSAVATKLFLYAMRRHRPGADFSLPHREFEHIVGFKNRQSFQAAKEELIAAGILVMTRNYVASLQNEERQCALYRMSDRVQLAPQNAAA